MRDIDDDIICKHKCIVPVMLKYKHLLTEVMKRLPLIWALYSFTFFWISAGVSSGCFPHSVCSSWTQDTTRVTHTVSQHPYFQGLLSKCHQR